MFVNFDVLRLAIHTAFSPRNVCSQVVLFDEIRHHPQKLPAIYDIRF